MFPSFCLEEEGRERLEEGRIDFVGEEESFGDFVDGEEKASVDFDGDEKSFVEFEGEENSRACSVAGLG